MTAPQDPFAAPGGGAEPPAQDAPQGPPPGYGQPPAQGSGQYGAPPQSGAPQHGAPQYGAPQYGAPQQYAGSGGSWQGPPLASWGSRVGSAIIDALPALAIELVGVGLGAAIGGGVGGLLTALGILGAIGWVFYNLVQQGKTGQGLGKRALKTRLLREQDGQVVGPGLSIGRAFVHVVDGIFYLGYLWPLWDSKKQTFADKILKTVVVKV